MLLDPPESLVDELATRHQKLQQATANWNARPSTVNSAVKKAAETALAKTVDKCSIEFGRSAQPRPTVEAQPDGTLKLLYPTP